MTYRIEIVRSALRTLARLPAEARRRIRARVDGLATDPRPHGAKALAGGLKGLTRLRAGAYRILYVVRDRDLVVLVVRIGHRADVDE